MILAKPGLYKVQPICQSSSYPVIRLSRNIRDRKKYAQYQARSHSKLCRGKMQLRSRKARGLSFYQRERPIYHHVKIGSCMPRHLLSISDTTSSRQAYRRSWCRESQFLVHNKVFPKGNDEAHAEESRGENKSNKSTEVFSRIGQ